MRALLRSTAGGIAMLLALGRGSAPLAAQAAPAPFVAWRADSLGPSRVGAGHLALGLGSVALLSLADRPIEDWLQHHRTPVTDAIAGVFRQLGTAPVYGGASVLIYGTGLVAGDDGIRDAGERLVASTVVTAAAVELLKRAVGRSRPDAQKGAWDFDPFRNRQVSFPSGHTAMAFMLTTSIADDVNSDWVRIPLYAVAAGTAWSRLNDRRHWPSDVLAGALLGITVGKQMSGHWSVLGIRQPGFLRGAP